MNYDLTIQYKDGRVSMRFLGIDFFALDKIFGTMPIKKTIQLLLWNFQSETGRTDLYSVIR